jgi:hypothetical protein
VDTVLQQEQAACDAVIAACAARVASRDLRIRTLEKREGGRLFLYGEAGAMVRLLPPLTFRAEGEAGLAFRLDRSTFLNAAVTTDQEAKVYVEKRVRLF